MIVLAVSLRQTEPAQNLCQEGPGRAAGAARTDLLMVEGGEDLDMLALAGLQQARQAWVDRGEVVEAVGRDEFAVQPDLGRGFGRHEEEFLGCYLIEVQPGALGQQFGQPSIPRRFPGLVETDDGVQVALGVHAEVGA